MSPDYKRIYTDLLSRKYPDKKQDCEPVLSKSELESLDVIRLNKFIFSHETGDLLKKNQSFRSYDKQTVLKILEYQKKNRLNNTQLANHFKLSRNTVARWKKEVSLFPDHPVPAASVLNCGPGEISLDTLKNR